MQVVNIPCKKNADGTAETYHDEDIHDRVYETVLKQAYEMFKVSEIHCQQMQVSQDSQ